MLEAADQAIDGEAVAPGGDDLFKGRRVFLALAADQTVQRQGQGADLALLHQPGQLGFAGVAHTIGRLSGFIAD